jgi:hypothetical protein
MYNTKFVCTYNTSSVFFGDENIGEKDEEFIRDSIYRQELLYILGMEDYNEREMNNSIDGLYKKIKENGELKSCMLKLASHFMCDDEKLGLMILYSFDYMHLTHICISELLETNKISEKNMFNLKSIIF